MSSIVEFSERQDTAGEATQAVIVRMSPIHGRRSLVTRPGRLDRCKARVAGGTDVADRNTKRLPNPSRPHRPGRVKHPRCWTRFTAVPNQRVLHATCPGY